MFSLASYYKQISKKYLNNNHDFNTSFVVLGLQSIWVNKTGLNQFNLISADKCLYNYEMNNYFQINSVFGYNHIVLGMGGGFRGGRPNQGFGGGMRQGFGGGYGGGAYGAAGGGFGNFRGAYGGAGGYGGGSWAAYGYGGGNQGGYGGQGGYGANYPGNRNWGGWN